MGLANVWSYLRNSESGTEVSVGCAQGVWGCLRCGTKEGMGAPG